MKESEQPEHSPHFKNKDPLAHVAERQIDGLLSSSEPHDWETPRILSAGADTCKELALSWILILSIWPSSSWKMVLIWSIGWILWKTIRGGWLGWCRLEKLHRVIAEEREEILTNREQEREEVRVLYQAKGFDGALLDQVVDVLTSDPDRLLKLMLEEELGLRLERLAHPLQQAWGAALGGCSAALCLFICFWMWPTLLFPLCIVLAGCAGGVTAYQEGNRLIPAIVWHLAAALLVGLTARILVGGLL